MSTEAGLGGLLENAGAATAPTRTVPAAAQSLQAFRSLGRSALDHGLTTRKSEAAEGTEHLLGAFHARRADALFARADPALAGALAADLAAIEGPGAAVGRALYLKAALARSESLLGSDPVAREAALGTLLAFSTRLTGSSGEALLAQASVIDLDASTSTSDFEPMATDGLRGVLHDAKRNDTRGDNDGLFQRFMGSCGTTTLQMALAEEDPVRAFVIRDAGLHSPKARDTVGRFQEEVLQAFDSAALGRRVKHTVSRLRNHLGRQKRAGTVTAAGAEALLAHVTEGKPLEARGQIALTALRESTDGFPDPELLAEVLADPIKGEDGLTLEDLQAAIDDHLGAVTGRAYDLLVPQEDADFHPEGRGFTDEALGRALDHVEASLEQGLDVPFGMEQPGHYMLMSATRRQGQDRDFLVSDPWTGRTAWVAEKDLISGAFSVDPFEQSYEKAPGYIDSFYVAGLPL
ncbi:MAG: hypothetical protein ACYS22_04890 [Planctomycetota bacterium]|jgi:hypothetical protein